MVKPGVYTIDKKQLKDGEKTTEYVHVQVQPLPSKPSETVHRKGCTCMRLLGVFLFLLVLVGIAIGLVFAFLYEDHHPKNNGDDCLNCYGGWTPSVPPGGDPHHGVDPVPTGDRPDRPPVDHQPGDPNDHDDDDGGHHGRPDDDDDDDDDGGHHGRPGDDDDDDDDGGHNGRPGDDDDDDDDGGHHGRPGDDDDDDDDGGHNGRPGDDDDDDDDGGHHGRPGDDDDDDGGHHGGPGHHDDDDDDGGHHGGPGHHDGGHHGGHDGRPEDHDGHGDNDGRPDHPDEQMPPIDYVGTRPPLLGRPDGHDGFHGDDSEETEDGADAHGRQYHPRFTGVESWKQQKSMMHGLAYKNPAPRSRSVVQGRSRVEIEEDQLERSPHDGKNQGGRKRF